MACQAKALARGLGPITWGEVGHSLPSCREGACHLARVIDEQHKDRLIPNIVKTMHLACRDIGDFQDQGARACLQTRPRHGPAE